MKGTSGILRVSAVARSIALTAALLSLAWALYELLRLLFSKHLN